jgi:ABC-type amino acid transport substrate-binding protein
MTQPFPTAGFWEGTAAHPTGGVSYAMAQELAKRLGDLRLRIETEDFSQIVAGRLGGADIGMALITPTSERDKVLDFTTPYIQSPPALLVRRGTSVPDLQTAQGLQFVVGKNTTFEKTVRDVIQPDRPALRSESRERIIDAVRSGTADVAMFDLAAAQAIVHDDPRLAVAARLDRTEPIALALPSGSGNTQAVSSALRAMRADGTTDRLARKWLGESFTDSAANSRC